MLPFTGYNMSDYFQHWLNIGEQIAKTGAQHPRFYTTNWFRKGEDGKFIWPGYGENMRVLKWIIDRIEGKAQGVEHPAGISPTFAEITWSGLSFGADQFKSVTAIHKDEWQAELKMHDELFTQLAHHLPQALVQAKQQLAVKVNALA